MNDYVETIFSIILLLYILSRYLKRRLSNYSAQTLEVVGLPVRGYEEDYILTDNVDTDGLSISSLLHRQGIYAISTGPAAAFEGAFDEEYASKYKELFYKNTGRVLPLVYKIKFNVEVEELSEKEIKQFWKKKNNDIME